MDKKTLIARFRQLEAADRNALDVYTELARLVKDESQRKLFSHIANDEKRHVALSKEMLSLLEK